jgi:DNA-binding SARP family transcriptional activator/tetratricopeptide (TPR) repeat protein
MIDLRVLGTLAIQSRNGDAPSVGVTQPKLLALLLYLALAKPSGPQSRESLMALLWPEADDGSTRHSLRNTLYGLRQALGEGAIVSRGEGYVELDPTAIRCDAVDVRGLLAAGRWKEALAGWTGDLAPGFHVSGAPEFERWLDEQRATFRRAVADAGWRRVDEMEKSGEPGIGEAARRAWAIDPTNEVGTRRLMQLLDATAGPGAALSAYDDLVDHLRREHDTMPAVETGALADRLRARTHPPSPPALSVAARSTGPVVLPPTTPATTPSGPPVRAPRRFHRPTLVAIVILIAAGASVVGLRSRQSAASVSSSPRGGQGVRLGELQLPARYRADTGAYGSYLRGLSLRFQGHHREALDTFAALVARAPQYPPGLAGLAHSYGFAVLAGLTPPSEGLPKAEEAARRAIALDSTTASAYLILAGIEMSWRWNLALAGQLIDKSLALDPGDAEAHIVRALWFRWREELDSALAEARTAHALDPLNASFSERVARHLYFLRRYDEAEAMYRRTLRDYPGGAAYAGLASVYQVQGRTREALEMMRADRRLAGDSAAAGRIPIATSDTQGARMLADLSREKLRQLAEAVRRGDLVTAGDWVSGYAGVGDVDETIRWIDSMRVGRDPLLWSIPIDPSLDFIRNDPRYREWEAKLPWRHGRR